jgi:hypothetical protein
VSEKQEEAGQLMRAYFDSPGMESKRALALGLHPERYDGLAPQVCRDCKQLLPATSFDLGIAGPDAEHLTFSLYVRCWDCHEKYLQKNPRQYPQCSLCGQKKHWRTFTGRYKGYPLVRDGTYIYLCCRDCEPAFLALPISQQAFYIRARCNLAFPPGQVIYGLVDPESYLVRNVGRTAQPKKRLQEHLQDQSDRQPVIMSHGQPKSYYSKANWMHDLYAKGKTPTMKILQEVEVAPTVIEWERRYILHGIQQGWPLVNIESAMDDLVTAARTSQLDFLHCSFEDLVQERFVLEKGIEAFVHQFYRP